MSAISPYPRMCSWTPERIEQLKALWQDGQSGGQIARRLSADGGPSLSRNAIIGKIHRLGVAKRTLSSGLATAQSNRGRKTPKAHPWKSGATSKVGSVAARKPGVAPKTAAVPAPAPPPAPPIVPPPRTFERGLATADTLSLHQCKWPIGDPRSADFTFCGRDAGDKPYCAVHAATAYRPKKPASKDSLLRLARCCA